MLELVAPTIPPNAAIAPLVIVIEFPGIVPSKQSREEPKPSAFGTK
jgi:hypothetical protein